MSLALVGLSTLPGAPCKIRAATAPHAVQADILCWALSCPLLHCSLRSSCWRRQGCWNALTWHGELAHVHHMVWELQQRKTAPVHTTSVRVTDAQATRRLWQKYRCKLRCVHALKLMLVVWV